MNIIKLLSKKKIYSILFIICLASFCYIASYNVITIPSDITPLSGGKYEAMFYVQNSETGTMTCIGDGLIDTQNEYSGDNEAVTKAIISAPDYSNYLNQELTISWDTIKHVNNEYQVIGVVASKADNRVVKYNYDTIADLKTCNAEIGANVKTLGAYIVGDGGASTYSISASPAGAVDNIFTVALNNGRYAILNNNGLLNVAIANINPNTNISDAFNNLLKIAAANGSVKTIQFNDGTYFIDKPIYLKSFTYVGSGNTILSVSTSFTSNGDKIMSTVPSAENSIFSLNFDNITFDFPTTNSHPMKNREMILLSLAEIDGCSITNCHFNSYPTENNGAYMMTDLLWFKHSNVISNINISGCTFKNLTGTVYNGDPKARTIGGCIWICGHTRNDLPMNNITINNCQFENTVNDETVGIWKGSYNNLSISNCSFINHSHDSDNILTFYNGSFNNAIVKDCQFTLNSGCKYPIKITSIASDSKLDFENIKINLSSGITDSTYTNISIFRTAYDSSVAATDGPAQITFNNVNVKSTNNTTYRSLVLVTGTTNKQYHMENCNIDVPLTYGLYQFKSASNCAITVDKSSFNTYNFISTLEDVNNCNFTLTNNKIGNKLTSVIRNNAVINCNYSNNVYSSPTYSYVFNCMNLSPSKDRIVYAEKNNTLMTNNKLNYLYSNNNLKQDSIIQFK